jgi:hypothetical protein
MKPKLAPRHIIPTVCYALLFAGFSLIAFSGFATDFISSESLEGTGMIGLLVVGLAVAAKFFLILIGIGGALFAFFPLVFSAINIAKRGRQLAIPCLVFDALWCQTFAGAIMMTLFDFESIAPVLVSAIPLALCVISLVANILNIKHSKPLPGTNDTIAQAPAETAET